MDELEKSALQLSTKHNLNDQDILPITNLLTMGKRINPGAGARAGVSKLRDRAANKQEKTRIMGVIAGLAELGLKGHDDLIIKELNAAKDYFAANGAASKILSAKKLRQGQTHAKLVLLAYEGIKAANKKPAPLQALEAVITRLNGGKTASTKRIIKYFTDLDLNAKMSPELKKLLAPIAAPSSVARPSARPGQTNLLSSIQNGANGLRKLENIPRKNRKPDQQSALAEGLVAHRTAATGKAPGEKEEDNSDDDNWDDDAPDPAQANSNAKAARKNLDDEKLRQRVQNMASAVTAKQPQKPNASATPLKFAIPKADPEANKRAEAKRAADAAEAKRIADEAEAKRIADAEAARRATEARLAAGGETQDEQRARIEAQVEKEMPGATSGTKSTAIQKKIEAENLTKALAASKKKGR
ncbi:MAG: hypothetical protein WCG04_01440 [Alphaproteobacteria bacterium]